MNCPSVYLQSKYGRMTQFLSANKSLKSKKICSQQLVKKNCSRKLNLLRARICSKKLLTEFARSIEKLLTIKNLAGSDGSTRCRNVLHQANRSTAGAHHSTVSFVQAGTCWAGPSRPLNASALSHLYYFYWTSTLFRHYNSTTSTLVPYAVVENYVTILIDFASLFEQAIVQ